MAGIAKSRELGRLIGRVPVGYKVVNKTVLFDPEKAELVKRIFNAYAAGDSCWKISTRLNMKQSTVSYILKNKYYSDNNANGKHEPLVSKELFDAIQPVLQQVRRPYQPVMPLVPIPNSTVAASPTE